MSPFKLTQSPLLQVDLCHHLGLGILQHVSSHSAYLALDIFCLSTDSKLGSCCAYYDHFCLHSLWGRTQESHGPSLPIKCSAVSCDGGGLVGEVGGK